jgi:hypothetical protein
METRRIKEVHKSMMFLLMHTLVSFFFVFCGFFVHLPFIFFFPQKCRKNKIQLKSKKKSLSLRYRFSALTLTHCLTIIATSNVKTHSTKVVDLVFLSFWHMDRLFWIKEVADNDLENRLVWNYRISKRFTSKANNTFIMTFYRNLVNTRVVDNFLSFPESTRT